jgi:hypothetical protein
MKFATKRQTAFKLWLIPNPFKFKFKQHCIFPSCLMEIKTEGTPQFSHGNDKNSSKFQQQTASKSVDVPPKAWRIPSLRCSIQI